MTGDKPPIPSTGKIVGRLLLTVLMVVGLVVCFRYCSQTVFLVVFIVIVGGYTAFSLWEASRSHGNRAKWGKEGDKEDR